MPTPSMITPAVAAIFQQEINRALDHIYTRVSRALVVDNPATTTVDESVDAWGEQTYATGVTATDLPCHLNYSAKGNSVVMGANGVSEIWTPTMIVPATDTISEGDLVKDVYGPLDPSTGARALIFAGPQTVFSVGPVTPSIGNEFALQIVLQPIALTVTS